MSFFKVNGDTGKMHIPVETETKRYEHAAKRHQWLLTLIGILLATGFGAAMYLQRYAQIADVDKIGGKVDIVHAQFNSHVAIEAARMSVVETQTKNIEADFHWNREQIQRIADRVGAKRVPPPDHMEKP